MDTVFEVKVTTDGAGLVRVALVDGEGDEVASRKQRFTIEEADAQLEWINETMRVVVGSAVLMGVL